MKFVAYIKSHWIIISVVLGLCGLEIYQISLITKSYMRTNELRKTINDNFNTLSGSIKDTELTVNSRIDIVDSAIKIDEKRRMLVKKTRDAITENTNTKLDTRTLNKMATAIIDKSYEYNLSMARTLAVIKQESDFNPNAVSQANAKGLGQIMDETADYLATKMGKLRMNVWDVNDNITMTCFYLAELSNTFKDFDKAVAAYNAGPTIFKKYQAGIIKELPNETKDYVIKVAAYEEIFKKYGLE